MAKHIKKFLYPTFIEGQNVNLIPNLIKHKIDKSKIYEPSTLLYNQIIE